MNRKPFQVESRTGSKRFATKALALSYAKKLKTSSRVAGPSGPLAMFSGTAAKVAKPVRSTRRTAAATKINREGEWMHFEYTKGTSNKFWQIRFDGKKFATAYGRIGRAAQSTTKTYANAASADREGRKLIAEKIKKGYRPVRVALYGERSNPTGPSLHDQLEFSNRRNYPYVEVKHMPGSRMNTVELTLRGKTIAIKTELLRRGKVVLTEYFLPPFSGDPLGHLPIKRSNPTAGKRRVTVARYDQDRWAVVAPPLKARRLPRVFMLVTSKSAAHKIKAAFAAGDKEEAYLLYNKYSE